MLLHELVQSFIAAHRPSPAPGMSEDGCSFVHIQSLDDVGHTPLDPECDDLLDQLIADAKAAAVDAGFDLGDGYAVYCRIMTHDGDNFHQVQIATTLERLTVPVVAAG